MTEIVTRWYTETPAISAFKLTTDIAMCCVRSGSLIWELVMSRRPTAGRRAKKKRPAGAGLCSDRMWRLTISRP